MRKKKGGTGLESMAKLWHGVVDKLKMKRPPISHKSNAYKIDETPLKPGLSGQSEPLVPPSPPPPQSGPSVVDKVAQGLGLGDIDMTSLGGVFYILVMGAILMAAGIFFLLVLVSIYAIWVRFVNEWEQTTRLKETPLLLQDTTDWINLQYIFNDPERDPYFIYFQQGLLANVFQLLGLAIFLIFFQAAVYLAMAIWSHLRDEAFREKFKHNFYVIGLGVVLLMLAIILRHVYQKKFLRNVQPSLRDMARTYLQIKDFMFDRMTMDAGFLNALTNDSTFTMMNYIQSSANSFVTSKEPENHALVRMAFTYNVYKYFYNNIPNHNKATSTLKEVFTPHAMRQRNILLPLLFIYQTPPLIQNIFLMDFKAPLEQALGPEGMQKFIQSYQSMLNNVDKQLRTLPEIEKGKMLITSFVNKYFFTIMAYVIFLMLLIGLVRYMIGLVRTL